MKVDISVPEVVNIFKEIQEQPDKIFEMIRVDIRQSVCQYLSEFMEMELARFLLSLGRQIGQVTIHEGLPGQLDALADVGERLEGPGHGQPLDVAALDRPGDAHFGDKVVPVMAKGEERTRETVSRPAAVSAGVIGRPARRVSPVGPARRTGQAEGPQIDDVAGH